jgi:uncharacterized protein (DUF1697 family)
MTYVVFLRAVNVAGHARVSMRDLQSAATNAGCDEASPGRLPGLLRALRKTLKTLLGEEPQLLVRSVDDLAHLIDHAPFRSLPSDPREKRYIAFLSSPLRQRPSFPLPCPKEALTAIGMMASEVFIVSRPKKNGFFGFPNNFIEKERGVTATSRNWSTGDEDAGVRETIAHERY